jgi:hypothetical protein
MEPLLAHLFTQDAAGHWVKVTDLCKLLGFVADGVSADLVMTWLPDPFDEPDFAIVVLFDYETKESLVAHYNRRRLVGDA